MKFRRVFPFLSRRFVFGLCGGVVADRRFSAQKRVGIANFCEQSVKNACKKHEFSVKYTQLKRYADKLLIEGKDMNISEVRVRLVKKDEGKLKAVASVTIDDCFVVHDVKILEGQDDFFIAMPSKKTPDGEYKDIVHPLNTETREMLKKAVLDEFEKARSQAAIDGQI